MVAMSLLLFVFRARDHRGLDGDLQGRGRSATHPKGRSAAEDAVAATFLPREEWAEPRGRKSQRRRCGSGDRGAAGLRPDRPKRGRGSAPNGILGEVVADPEGPVQE